MAESAGEYNKKMTQQIEDSLKNPYERLPISDRIIISKIRTLPIIYDSEGRKTINPYAEAINRFFDQIITQNTDNQCPDYLELKLHFLNQALKELWVIEARKGETFKLFQNFESFEKVLFYSNAEYRGHYIHQFDVFLLGYYILNSILQHEKTELAKIIKPQSERQPNLTWMLASTFHDIGYPIQKIDSWFSSFLSAFLAQQTTYPIEIEKILSPIFFDYLNFLSEEHYNQTKEPIAVSGTCYLRDWKFHNILLNNLKLKKDHGIISSLLLIHSLFTQEKNRDFNQWFFDTFEPYIIPACHAIAIHNLEINYEVISLRKSPFAFLLIFSDSIQDWERSTPQQDSSELIDITMDFSESTPTLLVKLKIHSDYKYRELDSLTKRLNSDNLIKITICEEGTSKQWSL